MNVKNLLGSSGFTILLFKSNLLLAQGLDVKR
jgi:hypothetical protein